jgi:hypothetical protein
MLSHISKKQLMNNKDSLEEYLILSLQAFWHIHSQPSINTFNIY